MGNPQNGWMIKLQYVILKFGSILPQLFQGTTVLVDKAPSAGTLLQLFHGSVAVSSDQEPGKVAHSLALRVHQTWAEVTLCMYLMCDMCTMYTQYIG